MADYIFCMRKKNNPRIDVRICQKKCPFKDECPEFLDYQRNSTDQSSILDSRSIISPLLNTMASKNWRRPYSREFTPLECSLGNTVMVLKYYHFFLISFPHHFSEKMDQLRSYLSIQYSLAHHTPAHLRGLTENVKVHMFKVHPCPPPALFIGGQADVNPEFS